MAGLKKGDTVYFPAVGRLVNEGTVESIEGPYIKVKSKAPGVEYVMASQAFQTVEELRASKAYRNAWAAQQQRRRDRESFARMASMASLW